MQKVYLIIVLSIGMSLSISFSQTREELLVQRAEMEQEMEALFEKVNPLKKKIEVLTAKIESLDNWQTGLHGTLGVNFTNFSNWVTAPNRDAQITTILCNFGGFVNKKADKYFWNNTGAFNLGWQKLNLNPDENEEGKGDFERIADIFNISSLFGYNISDKMAISVMVELRANLLDRLGDETLKKPVYLDIGGAGITWFPVKNLIITTHPLNYNLVFADESLGFKNSLGTKVTIDYSVNLIKGLFWRSNFSSFTSYSKPSELSNQTWTNSLNISFWKGIGVGIDMAIKNNKQESRGLEDDLQSYFILGLSYNL